MMDVFDGNEEIMVRCTECVHMVQIGHDGFVACRADQDMTPRDYSGCRYAVDK